MTLLELAINLKTHVWICTYPETGDILQVGLDAGYSSVIGVTSNEVDAGLCLARFKGLDKVAIFLKDEEIVMHEVIKDIMVPATFCLDARSSPPPALIHELSVLKHHRIKSHTIIVRNVSLFGTELSGMIQWKQVRDSILQIERGYSFTEYQEIDAMVAKFP